MKFNKNVCIDQNDFLIKQKIEEVESGLIDNSEAVQWLVDNALTVGEDGSVTIGELTFTSSMIQAIYDAYKPE